MVLADWPLLRRDQWKRSRKMCTVRTAWRRFFLRRVMLISRVGWPSARAKTLVDWSAVGMKGPPNFPAFEVHSVFHAAEGMDPLRTPCLIRCSDSCRWQRERGGARVVHSDCVHVRDSLSVWDGARGKDLFWWLWTVGSVLSIMCDFTGGAQVIRGRQR